MTDWVEITLQDLWDGLDQFCRNELGIGYDTYVSRRDARTTNVRLQGREAEVAWRIRLLERTYSGFIPHGE